MQNSFRRTERGCYSDLKWFLSLALIGGACISTVLISGDVICRTNIDNWIPYYPGATEISVDYDLVRLRAMGTSTVILTSHDDPETVRQFYRDTTITNLRGNIPRGLATTDWKVEDDPSGGSRIILYSECGR